MKLKRFLICNIIGVVLLATSAFVQLNSSNNKFRLKFPYKKMGLTEKQAAAHLLNRFSFGAKPGEVDAVVNMGIEKWFQQQLDMNLPDDEVKKRLTGYDALDMSNETAVNTFLNQGQILKLLRESGKNIADSNFNKAEYKEVIKDFMQKNNLKLPQEYQRQLINQKIIRAAYSNNQLEEVMTDFWFNHFNVSLTKSQCAPYIISYERDAIRPNVVGRFENLLLATAQHPAMLEYLDNSSSVSDDNELSRKQQNNALAKNVQKKSG